VMGKDGGREMGKWNIGVVGEMGKGKMGVVGEMEKGNMG